MAAHRAATRVRRELARGKDVLPVPFPCRARILAFQRMWQIDRAVTRLQVPPVQSENSGKVRLERLDHDGRQHGHTVLRALAIADQYLPVAEIHVFDAQSQALHQPQSGTVQQTCHQPLGAFELRQHRPRLYRRQRHRKPRRTLRPLEAFYPTQIQFKHIPIQEQNCRKRLVLGRRCHIALYRQMRHKRDHLRLAHLCGMPFAVEEDKASNPIDIALLGPDAVVFAPQHTAHQIQEPGICSCLLRRVCGFHANRVFVRAISVPDLLNGLICLKDDKVRRRIRYPDPVFRRSTLS